MRASHLSFMHPHVGGTYTVSSVLSLALDQIGVDLELFNENSVPSASNTLLASTEEDLARECINLIARKSPAAVYINILSSAFLTNLCKYIPAHIPVIAIVHNITPGTYRPVIAYHHYISHIVAVSNRIAVDLVRLIPALRKKISVVPTAVHPSWFNVKRPCSCAVPDRSFLFAGRIENGSKGVFKIARVVRQSVWDGCSLTIVGEGPDLDRLKEMLRGSSINTSFLGPLGFDALASQMAMHRFLLSPSNYEGQLLVNLEAMSVGCVPITSRIKGVTDSYIAHGSSGFLVDPRGFSDLKKAMHRARSMTDAEWQRISSQSIRFAASRFTVERMARGYRSVLSLLQKDSQRVALNIDAQGWSLPPSIARSAFFRSIIPESIKSRLRQYVSMRSA